LIDFFQRPIPTQCKALKIDPVGCRRKSGSQRNRNVALIECFEQCQTRRTSTASTRWEWIEHDAARQAVTIGRIAYNKSVADKGMCRGIEDDLRESMRAPPEFAGLEHVNAAADARGPVTEMHAQAVAQLGIRSDNKANIQAIGDHGDLGGDDPRPALRTGAVEIRSDDVEGASLSGGARSHRLVMRVQLAYSHRNIGW
jgi:hypothetical protein